jgi:RNA polymerase III RPC4
MNVSEGLTCGFEQQAVIIDPEKGLFVKLGNVHKTAVVTPDLDEAFNI